MKSRTRQSRSVVRVELGLRVPESLTIPQAADDIEKRGAGLDAVCGEQRILEHARQQKN